MNRPRDGHPWAWGFRANQYPLGLTGIGLGNSCDGIIVGPGSGVGFPIIGG